MRRHRLVTFRSAVVAPDVPEVMARLERAAVALGGVRLRFKGTKASQTSWEAVSAHPGPTRMPPHLSMRPAGREVSLRAELLDYKGPEDGRRSAEIAVLWGLAVPLGFIPWQRYPLEGPHDDVFHYLGPWAALVDGLHGEGRGEEAWPSACAAAQSDVGTWEGTMTTERTVQAQLHRLGIHCGPIDGIIGDRTLANVKAIGMGGMAMEDIAEAIVKMIPPRTPEDNERRAGQIVVGGNVEAFSSGSVHTTRTNTGYAMTIDGPGQVTLLIGE